MFYEVSAMKKSNCKRDNKTHQVNTRFTEAEYQLLLSKTEKAGVKISDFMRKAATDAKVEVRYDAPIVLKRMYEVQNNVNERHHMIMERIRVDEQRIDSLENLSGVNLVEAPFRIKREDVACDLAEIKRDTVELKMEADRELTDCVYF